MITASATTTTNSITDENFANIGSAIGNSSRQADGNVIDMGDEENLEQLMTDDNSNNGQKKKKKLPQEYDAEGKKEKERISRIARETAMVGE